MSAPGSAGSVAVAGGNAGSATAAAGAAQGGASGSEPASAGSSSEAGAGGVGGTEAGGAAATAGASGAAPTCQKPAGEPCHELLVSDNSRHQLSYVNELEPSKSWVAKVPGTNANSPRGSQLVDNAMANGGKAALVSVDKGFLELDLGTGKVLRSFDAASGVTSALRVPSDASTSLPAGTTILARELTPPQLDFVGPTGAEVRAPVKLDFASAGAELRKLERDPKTGNLSFTRYESAQAAYIYEVSELGELLVKLKLPAGCKGYNALWLDDGKLQTSTGESASVITLDAKTGAVSATVAGKGKVKDGSGKAIYTDFFSGFSRLPNGNVVVANWLGHQNPADYPTTPELLELTPSGALVWSWGNQSLATLVTYALVIR